MASQTTKRDHDAINGGINGYKWPGGYIALHRVAHDLTDRQREILHILSKKPSLPLREIRAAMDNPPSDRRLREELLHLKNSVWCHRPATGAALSGRCGGMTMNKAGNRAEIRRSHFALLEFETTATLKIVQSIRAKEERIMDTMGELEEILEK